MPKVAQLASRLGTFAPACAIFGLLLVHVGFIPPLGAFMFFQIALLCGLLALGFGIATVIVTRKDPEGPGRSAGWLGMAAGALMLTITVAGMGDGPGGHPINDITTDLDDPPVFAEPSEVTDFSGRDMSYPPDFVEIVRSLYADLRPVQDSRAPQDAYAHAISTAEQLGWEIVHRDPQAGTINARETSIVFKFVDDIVVRIRPDGSGSVIDLRSKSRVGKSDLGANAERIRGFVTAYGA
jgi:hypothetical protein